MIFQANLKNWLLVGVTLDAAALTGLCALLRWIGPVQSNWEIWLDLWLLVAVPYYVHQLYLPKLLGLTGNFQLKSLVNWLISVVMMVIAWAVAFFSGIISFVVGAFPFMIIFSAVKLLMFPLNEIAGKIAGSVLFMFIGGGAGAAVGGFLYAQRILHPETGALTRIGNPRPRSDILGGAIAGFIALNGASVANSLGMFSQTVGVPAEYGGLAGPPYFGPTLIIGLLALLPHLLMTGLDQFGWRQPQGEGRTPEAQSGLP